jgi:dipeptidyl aminopeptidase/acylaminoacyl peptidase
MPPGATDAEWKAATPTTYVKNLPPTILHHGLADTTVPPQSSFDFLKLAQDAKIASELHTLSGVPHAFINQPELVEITARLNDSFLERTVLNREDVPGVRRWRWRRPGGGGR